MHHPADPEEAIVDAALDLPTGERNAFLDKACGNDAPLRQLVDALLKVHQRAGSLREKPPMPAPAKTILLSMPLTEKPGDRIGRYKLLQQVGEGGCGVVYMAEQEEPVRRRVALKVIKLGMDTKQVIARFEAERQALALMDHPNIAKVLDAGATDTGRPFFVMELVRGIKITEYCDQNNLPTQARLDLFIQVCHAIQHAHQKGIIHRDIKPSNILVTLHDGVPVPKVIDFGIAKATEQRLTDKTLFTALEQFIGTPAYMSPEQAEMSGLDIDTRSDIYALGVLLYELLTGKTPFDPQRLFEASLDEVRRIVREEEPPRPSTRISKLEAAEQTTVAKRRQSEPPKLIHLVRGDMDWIVMKCLEKDRTRRYETANGIRDDIVRHLNNEPITARPPSTAYRFQKLVRRNKLAFGATSAIASALIIGLGLSTWLFLREKDARRRAVAAEKNARTEASKSQEVAQFLKDMLASVGPSVALGRDTRMLQEILDETAVRIGKDLADQPEVEAELRVVLAKTYDELALYTNALQMAREALRLRMLTRREINLPVADTLALLGVIMYDQRDLRGAEDFGRQGLEMRRKLLGNLHTNVAASLSDFGLALWRQGKLPEAEASHREALAIRTNLLGNENPEVAKSLSNLGNVQWSRGESAEAEKLYRQALALWRKLGTTNDPRFVIVLNNVGVVLYKNGDLAGAQATHREALAIRHRLYGKRHTDVAASLNNLADVLADLGDLAEAQQACQEGLDIRHELLGDENSDVAESLNTLGVIFGRQGRLETAEGTLRQALQMRKKYLANEQSDVADTLNELSLVLAVRGQLAEARSDLVELAAMRKKLEGDENPEVGAALWALDWVEGREVNPLSNRPGRARALAMGLHGGPFGVYTLARTFYSLSDLLQATGKLADAEPVLLEAAQYLQQNRDAKSALQQDALRRLVRLYESWDKIAPNTGKEQQAAKWRQKLQAFGTDGGDQKVSFFR